jgi:drug/metabolite transporter (DMT)-like permease
MDLPKIAVILMLLAIVAALFSGMYFLIKDGSDKRRTVRALSWRVGLQVALILFLVLAYFMGWIQPHNIGQ